MEEAEVPLEGLHEHVQHSAEHSGEVWISWVALSTAILAVLAAIAGLLFVVVAAARLTPPAVGIADRFLTLDAILITATILTAAISGVMMSLTRA